MLSKVLAGVFAIAVLTAGGYAYWQYTEGAPGGCGSHQTAPESTRTVPAPCCQEPSRSACPFAATDAPGCCDESAPVAPEVVAIQPRELK